MGLWETGQENSSRHLNSEVMQKSPGVRLGVTRIVNLQTEITEGGREGEEKETKELVVEQWGSEREEESGLQKEEREWSVSRERRNEKQLIFLSLVI